MKGERSLKSRALQLLAQRDQSRLELRRKLLRHARRPKIASAEGVLPEAVDADVDPSTVAGYRADLAMIAADFELARFDHAHGRNRAELLRRFWTDRDRLEMRAAA